MATPDAIVTGSTAETYFGENATLAVVPLPGDHSHTPSVMESLGNIGRSKAENIFSQNKYSVLQASKLMGIGQSTLRRIIHSKEIPVIWVGGKILLIERDIEAYLQSHYGAVQDTPKSQFTKSKLPSLPDSVKNSKYFRRAS